MVRCTTVRQRGETRVSFGFATVMVWLGWMPMAWMDPSLAVAQSPPPTFSHQSLLSTPSGGGYVQFYWCGGHLRLDPPRYRKGVAKIQTPSVREQLTVTARRGLPSVMYRLEQNGDGRQWSIAMDVTDAETVSLVFKNGEQTRVEIDQSPGENIVASMIEFNETTECTGATWMHLYEANRNKFPPMVWQFIDRLVPTQPIGVLCSEVRQAVIDTNVDGLVSRDEVHRQVSRLRSTSRAERNAGRKALMSYGVIGWSHLQSLDHRQLDAEQIAAIDSIGRRIRTTRPDYAASLATSLCVDPSYRALLK